MLLRLLAALLLASSCAGDGGDPYGDIDGSDKSDSIGVPTIETSLGASHDLEIRALATGVEASPETLRESAVILRFDVPADTSFACVMRATSGDLDSEIVLSAAGEDGWIDIAQDQGLLAMARSTDSVIVERSDEAATYVLRATSHNFASGGTFTIDLIPLSEDPGAELNYVGPGVQSLDENLRARESMISAYLAAGYYAESAAGLLIDGPALRDLPLSMRTEAKSNVYWTNEYRTQLWELYVEASQGYEDATDAQIARVGRVSAEIFAAVR